MTKRNSHLTFFGLCALVLSCLVVFGAFTTEVPVARKNRTYLQELQEVQKTAVLLQNQTGLVPLKNLNQKIASVNLGTGQAQVFDSLASLYTNVDTLRLMGQVSDSSLNVLNQELKFHQTVLLQVSAAWLDNKAVISFIQELQKEKDVVLAVYGPRTLLPLANGLSVPMIWQEQENAVTAAFAAQLVFGGVASTGQLDKTYSAAFKTGTGYKTAVTRLKYTVPEEVGIATNDLKVPIDAIVQEAIREKAAPGAVVMVVKDGKVIFHQAYGAHTYDGSRPTRTNDIFDVASVTKISATTMALMDLYDRHKLKLTEPLGSYVPSVRNSDKKNLTVRDVLLHQSGLPAGVGLPVQPQDVQKVPSSAYTVKASDSLFLRNSYFKEVLWPRMLSAKMGTPGKYVYSDLTMYFMKEVVERQAEAPLEELVQSRFYAPLGMQTAGFLPLNRFDRSRIVPTEEDAHFRKTLLQGYVHDGGAARLGGIAGHAGLFSSANDLAILYQMMLNRGTYGGAQYFKPTTVDLFTSRQSNVSRRGLGFDRWDPDTSQQYPSRLASPATYGHTGYTGTCVWVDPTHKLVYVFLSNRVHPKVSNKLISLKIRGRIQDAIYQAIAKATPAASAAGKS
ncbi:serine hydrolase [Rufibacter sp. LB8]|uniref:serine hydrolase domain-containing protein n=1 Tax=Rufibacter sp. LB8 TaxID=2777781 RepID=UPI00178C36A5|nr:serine hydrolase [Rufibacter sp. LB8]